MATDAGHSSEAGLPGRAVEDILAASRRRLLLSLLLAADRPLIVDDLAVTVAARERGTDTEAVDETTREAVRADIYESHLPKLTATGVVAYDSMRGTIELEDEAVARQSLQ